MNFFGHAVVASWKSDDPVFALGAMMPDFASMCRARVARAGDPTLAAGIAFHHTTDAAFHRMPAFVSLCGATARALRERGVAKGSARGAAHVAVELLLDGVLLDDERTCSLYLSAVAAARDPQLDIVWESPDHGMRWDHLISRIGTREVLEGYRDPDVVTDRVTRVLSRHARLALSDDDAREVRAEMTTLAERVAATTEEMVSYLRENLL